jgi:hypothetical protein
MRINDLYNYKFAVLIIKFFGGPVYFNILKIKLNLIPNTEANS